MATLGLSKVFILDKYFTELQKYWETERKLQDASSSNEKVHLKQRLQSLDSELVTLRNRIYVQGENMNALGPTQQQQQQQQPSQQHNSTSTALHSSHTNHVSNAINACHNQMNVLPPTLPKNQIPIPPHLPNTVPPISNDPVGKHIMYQTDQKLNSLGYYAGKTSVNNSKLQDLIYLRGPLTEDAVLKCLKARFSSSLYYEYKLEIFLSGIYEESRWYTLFTTTA